MEKNIRSLPGTIELHGLTVDAHASIIVLFIDGIACIERIELSRYKSKIYLKGGQSLRCTESVEEIIKMIFLLYEEKTD